MRMQSMKGLVDLTMEECLEVVVYVIAQSKRCDIGWTLAHGAWARTIGSGRNGESLEVHWKEIIATSMSQTITTTS